MSSQSADPPRWSRQHWFSAILATIVVQVALVFYFGGRSQTPPPAPRFATFIYAAADPWSAHQLAELPVFSDPTLFALPDLKGFSGSAWLLFAPMEHRLTDWTEPARWLPLDKAGLGQSFALLAATNVTQPLLIGDKALPRPTGLDVSIPNEPFATQSILRLEGDLASRRLLSSLDLPSWPSTGLVSNTVVQLLVDAAGYPLAATLLTESGSKEADQHALTQASAARFEPLRPLGAKPNPDLSWGKMVFRWATAPLTNAAAAAANP